MPLTLPGLIGRVFTAASNLFQQSTLSGDAFPSLIVFGDGRIYISDGTEDLTSGSLNYLLPKMYAKARPGVPALTLRGESTAGVRNIFEIEDYTGAGIFAVGNIGGVFLNDNFRQVIAATAPASNIFSDIYGHLQLGGNSAIRCTPGPPGNVLCFADATGEVFQQGRTNTQGTWTSPAAPVATYAGHTLGGGLAPTGLTWARAWTSAASSGTSIVVQTNGKTIAGTVASVVAYPCTSGQLIAAMIKTMSATVARSKTLALIFYNAAGTAIGSPVSGAAVTDTTTGWTTLTVQTVAPTGAVSCDLQLSIAATASSETHYDICAGIWPGLTTANVSAWNAPYCFRQNGFLPASVAASAVTGNGVSPIVITVPAGHPFLVNDSVTTSGFTLNTAANQAGAVITAITATSITIAGTGNGATSTGAVQLTNSKLGYYDGAYAGDVYIRSDGPSNVVQRFWTNATGGVPRNQQWVSDPRLTSQPARINWYGGTYLTQGATNSPDYVLPNVVLGMLHNDPPDSVNRGFAVPQGTGQYNLLNDAANAQAFGGFAAFTQAVRKKSTGAPYVAKDGMFAFLYGLWDLAAITSGGGSTQMSQFTGYSATPGGTGSAIINTMRDLICHARASVILPYTDSHFVLAGNLLSGPGFQYCYSGGGPGVAGSFAYWTSASGSFTFTIPADFTGGAVSIAMLGSPGVFGGTVTWTGTLFSTGGVANPGPTSSSNVTTSGSRARIVIRFKGLTSANAGQTIIGTMTAMDASGDVALDCAYIEGQYPNMVAVCGMPKLLNAAAYVTAGGAGSYWNGNAGATGDTDIATLNASLQSLVAEFDSNIFYVDLDAAMQKQAQLFAADGVRIDELGVHAMASQFAAGLNAQLPLVNFRNVNHDYHDTTIAPVGAPFSRQGPLAVTTGVSRFYADDYYYLSSVRASVGTPPIGASVIVDVLKNGSTIFTTSANRPAILTGASTAVSAAPPDLLFLLPGDYLTVNVAQTGTTTPGADLTVNVLGRKIPIP